MHNAAHGGLVALHACLQCERTHMFEFHRGQLSLSRQPLRYIALGTGCAPLLQYL